MEYQVLARKWRPKNFHQMVGQEHVLRALINALDQDRVHHAYLFTGTRGVGKTTIARIFAKCLNCEIGVTSKPCGSCGSCVEVDEGRFIDLIEVDAASRTRVEDTRELLENVQYAPTRGRYKVYLIDEVHMLSNHSFNALLKTLEEPPPHVKFLLATTDPQKLPVTILSRCLQFSLKALSARRIAEYLKYLMTEEAIAFEDEALASLARAATGSMRDALSLTDQAIAFGGDSGVLSSDVQTLLGSIDRGLVFVLLKKLIEEDGLGLLQTANQMLDQGAESKEVLAELIEVLHAIAVAQIVPEAVDNNQVDREKVIQLAKEIQLDDVQLYYQIALMGRKDLPLVPNPRSGLEMVLLRMLSFKPQGLETPMPPSSGLQKNRASLGSGPVDASASQPSSKIPPHAPHLVQGQALPSSSSPAPQPPAPQSKPPQVEMTSSHTATQVRPTASSGTAAMNPGRPITSNISELKSLIDSPSKGGGGRQQQPLGQTAAVSISPRLSDEVNDPDLNSDYDEYSQSPGPQSTAPQAAVAQPAGSLDANAPISDRQNASAPGAVLPFPAPAPAIDSTASFRARTAPEPSQRGANLAVPKAQQAPPPQLDASSLVSLDWADIIDQLGVDGAALNFARNVALESRNEGSWRFKLKLSHEALYREHHVKTIEAALQGVSTEPLAVIVEVGKTDLPTPAEQRLAERQAKLEAAERNLYADPLVNQLINELGAQIDKNSIQPVE